MFIVRHFGAMLIFDFCHFSPVGLLEVGRGGGARWVRTPIAHNTLQTKKRSREKN